MTDLPSVDGPHTPDSTAATAALLAEAVRVLNHATLPNRATDTLPYPSDVARLLGHLGTALERLPQLYDQLADRVKTMAATMPLTSTDGNVRLTRQNLDGKLAVAAGTSQDAALAVARARSLADRLGVED